MICTSYSSKELMTGVYLNLKFSIVTIRFFALLNLKQALKSRTESVKHNMKFYKSDN